MSQKKIDKIVSKLPAAFKLPPKFSALSSHDMPFSIEWNSLKPWSLKRSAGKEAVPFARLGDGGLLAFWFREKSTPIIHLGHGELKVVAIEFAEFLKAINTQSTGLPDIDEDEDIGKIPRVTGRAKRKGLAALNREFQAWVEYHNSSQPANKSPEGERLRKKIYSKAKSMIRDGLSKVYDLKSSHWCKTFRIERTAKGVSVKYLDYGKWHKLPAKYKLEPLFIELLTMVKHPKRKRFELEVWKDRTIFVERGNELYLSDRED